MHTGSYLQRRFVDLWERSGAKGDPLFPYADLVHQYVDPYRAYHRLSHIMHCLDEFEEVQHLAGESRAVEWALWYHDSVYKIGSRTNESDSAEFLEAVLMPARVAGAIRAAAMAHIMATAHAEPPTDPDSQLVVDIDLAILGQPRDIYRDYVEKIYVEYIKLGGAPLDGFAEARAGRFLRPFLSRQCIYSTHHFASRYEAQARRNLAWELAESGKDSWRQASEEWVR